MRIVSFVERLRGLERRSGAPSGRALYNHVTVSVGFMSSSDRRVHFGLGQENRASTIEIRWPSGTIQKLTNVPADRIVDVEEPRESSPSQGSR